MSQSPSAGSPPLPPWSAPVPARSCRCEVRSPEEDVSLWRAPSEGAGAWVLYGAAGKVEAQHGPVPIDMPGMGKVEGRGGVGVSENVCVCAHVCVSGRRQISEYTSAAREQEVKGLTSTGRPPETPDSQANRLQLCSGLTIHFYLGAC